MIVEDERDTYTRVVEFAYIEDEADKGTPTLDCVHVAKYSTSAANRTMIQDRNKYQTLKADLVEHI